MARLCAIAMQCGYIRRAYRDGPHSALRFLP